MLKSILTHQGPLVQSSQKNNQTGTQFLPTTSYNWKLKQFYTSQEYWARMHNNAVKWRGWLQQSQKHKALCLSFQNVILTQIIRGKLQYHFGKKVLHFVNASSQTWRKWFFLKVTVLYLQDRRAQLEGRTCFSHLRTLQTLTSYVA